MHFDREVPVKVSSDQKMPCAGQGAVGKASKGPWGHLHLQNAGDFQKRDPMLPPLMSEYILSTMPILQRRQLWEMETAFSLPQPLG